ncbi:unnamed protein product [Ascophyllum nodosum]
MSKAPLSPSYASLSTVIDTAVFSVSNMYRSGNVALDIFGDKTTSDARRRCQPDEFDTEGQEFLDLHLRVAMLYTLVYGSLVGMPFCEDPVATLMNESSTPLSLVFDGADPSVETPWGLAKTYFDEINAWMTENDGWNADGSANREFNRVPFSDYALTDSEGNSWTPYIPRNTPWEFKKKKRWQPLTESDGLGYISSQEHVVPFIGATARYFGFESYKDEEAFANRELDDPDYQYTSASIAVLEETRDTVGDNFKRVAIDFFDNKFGSLIPLKIQFFVKNANEYPPLDFYQATVEVQLAIYNGVVLAWKEKVLTRLSLDLASRVRHDLPRPPSVIDDKLGDKTFTTYAGPDEEEPQEIKASEWEPFIRTMPHSEFPSGSACICQAFAEQVAHFLGSDKIEGSLDATELELEELNEFSSWSEISEVCANSRVWGGMHFADAATAGTELCGGGLLASSISSSISALIAGDESAAVFKKEDVGEQMVRPLTPGSARRGK